MSNFPKGTSPINIKFPFYFVLNIAAASILDFFHLFSDIWPVIFYKHVKRTDVDQSALHTINSNSNKTRQRRKKEVLKMSVEGEELIVCGSLFNNLGPVNEKSLSF